MTKKEEIYEKWLETIKSTEPILDKPEELTSEILNRIKTLPVGTYSLKGEKGKKSTNKIWVVISKISGIAAVFLLCFLVRETIFFPRDTRITEHFYTSDIIWQEKISSQPDSWDTESTFLEKSRHLSEQWKDYKKELSKRKASFLSKRISIETINH